VQPLSTGLWIVAAVLPAEPLKLPPHLDRTHVEIDVGAPQTERFALPQSEAHPDGPAERVAPLQGGLEDSLRLVLRQRRDLDLGDRGSVNEGCDVPADDLTSLGDFQRPRDDPVHLEYVRRSVPFLEQAQIQLVQVLRPEPVEAVFPNAGNDVVARLRPVDVQTARLELLRRDGRQVGRHPLFDSRHAARLRDTPGVALLLQRPDLLLDLVVAPG
jgi:hypothetical protein